MSAALEVQKWIYDALGSSAELANLLGGSKVFDDVPDNASLPYITFGEIISDDWSTGTEGGEEHSIELIAWSKTRGRKEVTLIADACKSALSQLQAPSTQQQLINFTHESTKTARLKSGKLFSAVLNYRAVTEPITD